MQFSSLLSAANTACCCGPQFGKQPLSSVFENEINSRKVGFSMIFCQLINQIS